MLPRMDFQDLQWLYCMQTAGLTAALFKNKEGSVELLLVNIAQAGINHTRFAGHSFHIGAATTAAAKGIDE